MPDITQEQRDETLILSFNRPDKKNSVTADMYTALSDALVAATDDSKIRLVLIRGSEETFSAGNDLGDFLKAPPKADNAPVWRFLQTLAAFPKPVLAAVSGPAVGIGTTLLFHCDFVLATPTAKFILPFVNLGLTPEGCSSLILPQLVGHRKASEILMLGEAFGADEAMRFGIVNKIVPLNELFQSADELAQKLLEKPQVSLVETKKLLRTAQPATAKERILFERDMFVQMLEGPAVKEAVAAFKEKRKPKFNGNP